MTGTIDVKGQENDIKMDDERGMIMVHGEWFTVNGFLMENGENSHKL